MYRRFESHFSYQTEMLGFEFALACTPDHEVPAGHDIAGAMSNAYLPDTLATFHEQLRAA
jgi:hypothetical protein